LILLVCAASDFVSEAFRMCTIPSSAFKLGVYPAITTAIAEIEIWSSLLFRPARTKAAIEHWQWLGKLNKRYP
jgi:hypothetical protein